MLYLIGKQGISYQGTQETASNGDTLWNSGIFLVIARQVTHCYLLLYQHINWPLQKDISYMSPASQNKFIDVAAKYIIVCMCMCRCIWKCVYIRVNETMMVDYTIKDTSQVWHKRLCVFLFSNHLFHT